MSSGRALQRILGKRATSKAEAEAEAIAGSPEIFAALLNEQNLRRLAGPRFYERGVNYAIAGHVIRVVRLKRSVEASVEGTSRYRVELWVERGELSASCTCPVGERGLFCKHCVATGLVALGKSDHQR